MKEKIKNIIDAWNGSSGSLESNDAYLEELKALFFKEEIETPNRISDSEKLSTIFRMVYDDYQHDVINGVKNILLS